MTDPYYFTAHWRALCTAVRRRSGGMCEVPGCGKAGKVVDHIIGRRQGGPDALLNLRHLCRQHDNQVKERADGKRANGGKLTVPGCDASGRPRDPNHPWNAGDR